MPRSFTAFSVDVDFALIHVMLKVLQLLLRYLYNSKYTLMFSWFPAEADGVLKFDFFLLFDWLRCLLINFEHHTRGAWAGDFTLANQQRHLQIKRFYCKIN